MTTDRKNRKFTEEEVKYLKSRGWFTYGDDDIFTRKSSHDDGSDSYSLKIDEEGDVVYWSMVPVNVDCDTGKSDTEYTTSKYKTFEDFKAYKHYYEDKYIK